MVTYVCYWIYEVTYVKYHNHMVKILKWWRDWGLKTLLWAYQMTLHTYLRSVKVCWMWRFICRLANFLIFRSTLNSKAWPFTNVFLFCLLLQCHIYFIVLYILSPTLVNWRLLIQLPELRSITLFPLSAFLIVFSWDSTWFSFSKDRF